MVHTELTANHRHSIIDDLLREYEARDNELAAIKMFSPSTIKKYGTQ